MVMMGKGKERAKCETDMEIGNPETQKRESEFDGMSTNSLCQRLLTTIIPFKTRQTEQRDERCTTMGIGAPHS
jgi:hypothetical protein